MANNLIFPIGFDLEKGVKDAQAQMDSVLRRLQKTVDGKPLTIPMNLDPSKFTTFEAALRGSIRHITDDAKNFKTTLDSSLQTDSSANINRITEAMRKLEDAWKALPNNQKFDVDDRLTPKAQKMVQQFNELATASSTYGQTLTQIAGKIRRAAEEETRANQKRQDSFAKLRKTLGAQENSIANITAKIKAYQQSLNSREIGSKSFERAAEKIRKLSEKLDEAKRKVSELTGKAKSVDQLTHAFSNQETYLSRLVKRMVMYASFSYVSNFLTSVREVTAEFELQRVSLGAIIQDQLRANQLFAEIKSFALKSPLKILDLTKYTKQLAAYRIEADQLFDTTKRLADISVGLGVSMDRLILAYGQVKATGYLRGCLGKGTLVVMFDGSRKKVEDVVVGDVVMGDDERGRNVLSLIRNREMMYIVNCGNGSFRCNENHILTVYNTVLDEIEDIYVLDYLKHPCIYKGVRRSNGQIEYFDMTVQQDCVDDYYGFEIDGNKRFIIEDNIITHNSEVRQFTEAGLGIVDALAEKLSVANGELVKASDVMDMISKREIPFEMVAEIFQDMTDKGGMFYNMQEKQGNTLYGMWQKLGDAAAVMYDEIGNTGAVNEAMKSSISMLRTLMIHWRQAAVVIGVAATALLKWRLAAMAANLAAKQQTAQHIAYVAALRAEVAAQNASTVAVSKWNITQRINIWFTKAATRAKLEAATANGVLARSFHTLRAAMLSNPWTLIIGALTTIGALFLLNESRAHKLAKSIDEIDTRYANETLGSKKHFVELADAATQNANGSRKQTEALEELKRAYGDILPAESLELENLQQLHGAYGALTDQIELYYAKRKYEEKQQAIKNNFTEVFDNVKADMRKTLESYEVPEDQIAVAMSKVDSAIIDGLDVQKIWNEILNEHNIDQSAVVGLGQDVARHWYHGLADSLDKLMSPDTFVDGLKGTLKGLFLTNPALPQGQITGIYEGIKMGTDYSSDLAKALDSQAEALAKVEEEYDNAARKGNEYIASLEKMQKILGDNAYTERLANSKTAESWSAQYGNYKSSGGLGTVNFYTTEGLDEFKAEMDKTNAMLQDLFNNLKGTLVNGGVAVKEEWFDIQKSVTEGGKGLSSVLIKPIDDAIKTVEDANKREALRSYFERWKKGYEALAPSDFQTRQLNLKLFELAESVEASMKANKNAAKKSEEGWKDYKDRMADYVEASKQKIRELNIAISRINPLNPFEKIHLDNMKEQLEQEKKDKKVYEKGLAEATLRVPDKNKNKGNRKSDTRLQILQEIVRTVESAYNEFDTLSDKIGESTAKLEVWSKYDKTFEDLAKSASKLGFKIKIPDNLEDMAVSAAELAGWLAEVKEYLEGRGSKIKGADKFRLELGRKSSDILLKDWQKTIDAELKQLAERISRTKTAKEFYDKVLGMTGDVQLSANLAVSVYGQNGQALQDAIREQITSAFESGKEGVEVDLSEAIDPDTGAINYNKLAELEEKYKDVLIKDRGDLRKKLIEEGRKASAAQVQQWLKDIEKAKDFAQQRIDLATYTANQIAAINAREDLPQADKDRLIKGYQDREAKQLAKLQYDEFKDSAMYVHIFEDLDHASTTALKNMRDRLIALKGQWQHLDPTQVKELTKAIADLDEKIAGRSPFKSMIDGFKGLAAARPQKVIDAEMLAATDELAKREEKLASATEKLTEAQTAQVNAQAEVAQARQDLDDALAVSGGDDTPEVKAAREVLGLKIAIFNAIKAASAGSIAAAKADVDAAAKSYEDQKKVIDALVKEGRLREANIKKIELANEQIDRYQEQINEALGGIRKMMEAFGASEEDLQFFDDVVGALNEITDAGQQAAASVGNIMSGNPFQIFQGVTQGIGAIGGLFSGFANLFSAGKVRKANKEIKRQQELLEKLEYTYGRLDAAKDKVFGLDYVNNYRRQVKNLQAQQEAYEKQARAERSKGKKADKEKIKDYENQARDTADKIKEMQDDLEAHFTGQSRTDVARQMAKSWLDARASMSDTFGAIKNDYAEMIKNMIVEGAAARVMENALTPMWNSMEKMLADNDVDGAIDALIGGMDSALEAANNGMEVLWQALEARGYDMKQLIGDVDSGYTGIAKDIAGATSEEINANTAALNTQNYYASHLPLISENVSIIARHLMERGATSGIADTSAAGWTDWQQQAMDNYKAIAANTAATVAECRRAANACEAAVSRLESVTSVKNGKRVVNTAYV